MTNIIPMFHILEDVCIPSSHDMGYVFAIADTGDVLIKDFTGSTIGWFGPNELCHLERWNGARSAQHSSPLPLIGSANSEAAS